MKTIWKFPLEITDEQTIELPLPAHILSVQMQNGELCLWAGVSPRSPVGMVDKVKIYIYGTGNPMPDDNRSQFFIDTVQQGPLVWHVFHGPTYALKAR